MNTAGSDGFWKLFRERLRERYPELTGSDLNCAKGHETEMLRRIEKRLHKTPLEMAALLDELFRSARPDVGSGPQRQQLPN